MVPKYPNVTFLDVLLTSGGVQASSSACQSWTNSNNLTHPVLRDKGSGGIALTYKMGLSDIMIVDRNIKIVFKAHVTDTLAMAQVSKALSLLPP